MTSDREPNDPIDLEAFDLGPLVEKARTATFAPNWKSVLAADAFVGLVIVAIGVAALLWTVFVGVPIIVIGCIYIFLVHRRFLQWRWLRQQVGLE